MVDVNVDIENALVVTEKFEDTKDDVCDSQRFSVALQILKGLAVPFI